MTYERRAVKCIMLLSIIGLGIAIIDDLALVRSAAMTLMLTILLLVLLTVLVILSLSVLLRMRRDQFAAAESCGPDMQKKVRNAINCVVVFGILAAAAVILKAVDVIPTENDLCGHLCITSMAIMFADAIVLLHYTGKMEKTGGR